MAVSLIHEMIGVEIQTSDICYPLRGPSQFVKTKNNIFIKTDKNKNKNRQELKMKGL